MDTDESKSFHEKGCTAKFKPGLSQTEPEFDLRFDPSSNCKSLSLLYLLKSFLLKLLLHGADKVVKDRRVLKQSHSLGNGLVSSSRACDTKRVLEQNEYEYGHFSNYYLTDPNKEDNNGFTTNFLAFIVALIMKFVGFQISLMISFLTFPIWSSYILLMFFLFPFQTLRQVKGYFVQKALTLWGLTFSVITSSVSRRAKAQKSRAMRIGRAFFSSLCLCFMLVGLLALGFFVGGFMVQKLLEKPIRLRENLNFDYSKPSPVAFVPLKGVEAGDETRNVARVVPRDHKLQVSVSMVVPESEYNQELGVFQVRVEFLSENGKTLASSGFPSILRFKSRPIRYMETFLSAIPLIAGFQSESQILNIKFTEFTEGTEPTACVKIAIEQRAKHELGAGIPQIYEASLLLESELPRLKRFLWHWRRTVFVWSGIVSFLIELVVILAFLLVPRPVIGTGLGKKNIANAKILKD